MMQDALRWIGNSGCAIALAVAAAFGPAGPAWADDDAGGDDATITVVTDGEMPDDVVNLIQLPAQAAPAAGNASGGTSTANEAQQGAAAGGSDFGQSVANEARASSGVGAEVRDAARQQTRDDTNPGKGHGPPAH
jgi:hypothetical protein